MQSVQDFYPLPKVFFGCVLTETEDRILVDHLKLLVNDEDALCRDEAGRWIGLLLKQGVGRAVEMNVDLEEDELIVYSFPIPYTRYGCVLIEAETGTLLHLIASLRSETDRCRRHRFFQQILSVMEGAWKRAASMNGHVTGMSR
jgi:hypothetical protein